MLTDLTQSQFTVLILMAFVITLIATVSLRATVPAVCSKSDRDFCELWRGHQVSRAPRFYQLSFVNLFISSSIHDINTIEIPTESCREK